MRWTLTMGLAALAWLNSACSKRPTEGRREPKRTATKEDPDPLRRLRVLTFNTWLVPFRTDRQGLPTRIASAVAADAPHVVALQEVWVERDARALAAALALHGYRWVHWRAARSDWFYGSPGLMIASVFPLSRPQFVPYRAGRWPMVPWQPDFFSAKGVLSVDVAVPGHPIRFVNTHAQADYATNRYDAVRLSQMLQLAGEVNDIDMPVIVAGDINVRRGEVGRDALLRGADLEDTPRSHGVDAILVRSSAALGLSSERSHRFDGRDAYGDMSDHTGVLATIALNSSGRQTLDSAGGANRAVPREQARLWAKAGLALLVAAAALASMRRWRARAGVVLALSVAL